ncbi:MAG: DUF4493 domain-containing protein [Muribaculaceae bacterium]|nr:DUF4493 domain-containing protein [Muribaculaceae bacterium]
MLCASCSNEENSSPEALGHVSFDVSVTPDTVNIDGKRISLTMMSSDGRYSHTWDDYRDFSVIEGFYAGEYQAKAVLGQEGSEGYDCECYIGISDFSVADNQHSFVQLVCSLSQAKLKSEASESLLQRFPEAYVVVHTVGASYVDVDFDNPRPAFVTPGVTSVLLCLSNSGQDEITIDTGMSFSTQADEDYTVSATLTGDVLSVSAAGQSAEMVIGEAMLDSAPPVVSCQGFHDGEPVYLTEGFPSESAIVMDVDAPVPLSRLTLTSVGAEGTLSDLPAECNLLDKPQTLLDMGLVVDRKSDRSVSVDFSGLLENLSVRTVSDMCFLLQASDVLGRASRVAALKVSITGVEMTLVDKTPAVLGDNIASVTLHVNADRVEGSDFSVVLDDRTTADVEPLEIISTSMTADKNMVIEFAVPEGISSLPVRIDYMDKPKLAVDIQRELPEYSFSIDAFATTIVAGISASTPQQTAAITKYARIFAGNKEMAILSRDVERGYLYCAGFDADHRYDVRCVVLKDGKGKSLSIRTEVAEQVPDGSFEDVTGLISYAGFPSGGTYSATSFPIFNQQNFVDYDVRWPRNNWASINDKTFCLSADMHNTWYMQPSSAVDFDFFVAGSKSIKMTSVGWSLHGSEIEPYVQPVDAFESYNANYPPIDNISAGYLFLGNYSFNPDDRTEVITEGVKFTSRPSSLNGYFKYSPDDGDPSDRGWVRVQVIGDGSGGETVIGEGYMEFPYAPDFRSFNIPISYTTYYTPATRLKILFCSSVFSDGLSFDDPEVPVTADIPNSRYIGSSLWVDNLSFSY